jgi:hypothetical protein
MFYLSFDVLSYPIVIHEVLQDCGSDEFTMELQESNEGIVSRDNTQTRNDLTSATPLIFLLAVVGPLCSLLTEKQTKARPTNTCQIRHPDLLRLAL